MGYGEGKDETIMCCLQRWRLKRVLTVAAIAVVVICVGAGCRNLKSVELDFGGLDVEYFPTHPSQEEKSIFDFSATTNRVLATPAYYPKLMPMRERK